MGSDEFVRRTGGLLGDKESDDCAMKKADFHKELGLFLKEYRLNKGLSQGAVARVLGYSSAQFVSNFERGLCSPPLQKLRVLVDLYGIPVDMLTELLVDSQKRLIEAHLSKKIRRRAS